MPFPCQTHLRALQLIFEVRKLDHREGNHVDIQIKTQQHPPTYQLKRGQCYWVYQGTSKRSCAMNGVIHCLSDGMWQHRYRLSLTRSPSWITSESGCKAFASWLCQWRQAKLKELAHPLTLPCTSLCVYFSLQTLGVRTWGRLLSHNCSGVCTLKGSFAKHGSESQGYLKTWRLSFLLVSA